MGIRTSKRTVDEPGDVANGCVGTSLGREPLARIGAKALHAQLHQMRDHVTAVCEESGVEDIHQMRVATRRMRTMARLLETTPAFRRMRVKRLRGQLQPLADHLGAVRDLDIFLEHLAEYERAIGESSAKGEAHSPLREDVRRRRKNALSQLHQTLQRPAIGRLLRHPRRATKRLVVDKRSAREVLVRYVAGGALWSRYEAILRFEVVVADDAAAEQLHPLRIACKQLRYALELFADASDPCAQSLLATLKDVQTHLGDLQDSVFAIALLELLRKDHPDDALLDGFLAAREAQRDTLLQSFTPLWERISGAPYRHDLAALIAAL
jgi:CHAD domain-containing protein